jgi:hypothetical protein
MAHPLMSIKHHGQAIGRLFRRCAKPVTS